MAYTFGKNNRTILVGIPEAPPAMLNISRHHGIYVIGDTDYVASRTSLAPNLQRQIGNRIFVRENVEEFVTGMLSVILIHLFSEIVQAILLRNRHHMLSKDGVHSAYLLDEFSHFRNLWKHATSLYRHNVSMYRRVLRKRTVMFSLVMLTVAAIVFAADVLAVYVTLPHKFTSSRSNFNVRGVQPITTAYRTASKVRYLAEERPCIAPKERFPTQRRHFRITTCTTYGTNESRAEGQFSYETITLNSWYHKGGNDHNISVGGGWHSVMVRAMIFLDDGASTMKRILFRESEIWMNATRYLHELTMYTAMQQSCNHRASEVDCLQLVEQLIFVNSTLQSKKIRLWSTSERDVFVDAVGLVSTYRIRLVEPYKTMGFAKQSLVASSAVLEVKGEGWYENELRREDTGIPGLISEEGRIAGLYMLSAIVLICGVVLTLLRLFFNSISFGSVAVDHHAGVTPLMGGAMDMILEPPRKEMKVSTGDDHPSSDREESEDSFEDTGMFSKGMIGTGGANSFFIREYETASGERADGRIEPANTA